MGNNNSSNKSEEVPSSSHRTDSSLRKASNLSNDTFREVLEPRNPGVDSTTCTVNTFENGASNYLISVSHNITIDKIKDNQCNQYTKHTNVDINLGKEHETLPHKKYENMYSTEMEREGKNHSSKLNVLSSNSSEKTLLNSVEYIDNFPNDLNLISVDDTMKARIINIHHKLEQLDCLDLEENIEKPVNSLPDPKQNEDLTLPSTSQGIFHPFPTISTNHLDKGDYKIVSKKTSNKNSNKSKKPDNMYLFWNSIKFAEHGKRDNIYMINDEWFYCSLCKERLHGTEDSIAHVLVDYHQNAIGKNKSKSCEVSDDENSSTVSHGKSLDRHYDKETINSMWKKVDEAEGGRLYICSVKRGKFSFFCKLCQIPLKNPNVVVKHVYGKWHQSKINPNSQIKGANVSNRLLDDGTNSLVDIDPLMATGHQKHASRKSHRTDLHQNSQDKNNLPFYGLSDSRNNASTCKKMHPQSLKDCPWGKEILLEMWQQVNEAENGRNYYIKTCRTGPFQYFCHLCDIKLLNPNSVVTHVRGRSHQINLGKSSDHNVRSTFDQISPEDLQCKGSNNKHKYDKETMLEMWRKVIECEKGKRDNIVFEKKAKFRFYCKLCEMHLLGPDNVIEHVRSRWHQVNLEYNLGSDNTFDCVSNNIDNASLQEPFQSNCRQQTLPYEDTLREMWHKVIELEGGKRGHIGYEKGGKEQFRCHLCDIKINSPSSVIEHVRSRCHQNNLDTNDVDQNNSRFDQVSNDGESSSVNDLKWLGGLQNKTFDKEKVAEMWRQVLQLEGGNWEHIQFLKIGKFAYRCHLCDIPFVNPESVIEHVRGATHQEILARKQVFGKDFDEDHIWSMIPEPHRFNREYIHVTGEGVSKRFKCKVCGSRLAYTFPRLKSHIQAKYHIGNMHKAMWK